MINIPGNQPLILGMRVDPTSYAEASRMIIDWAGEGASRYVCFPNVYNVMQAYDSKAFRRITNDADLVTPDGMPLVWGLKHLGYPSATRVYGPDLTLIVLQMAADAGIPVGFYGSTPDVLAKIRAVLSEKFPHLHVAYGHAPPFSEHTSGEDGRAVALINASGARILFVGLGTPKQDYWMAGHRGKVQAVMLGVGAAFDFLAGTKPQAPRWMMRIGMEWFFRLITEPRRLWKRYLRDNPRFVVLFALQLLGVKRFPNHVSSRH